MALRIDPEQVETTTLLRLAGDLSSARVLEVGCGDGRLTWRYARHALRVLAIDPDRDAIAVARDDLPEDLRGRVELRATGLEELDIRDGSVDVTILAWSL
jgi:2-polyprenyl-3-methyl-5-hydroxy-6-metoxy-1,4-benzoquinol methylase